MVIVFLVLGLVAGVLTTLAGQGGGLLLLLACTRLVGPHAALAITAPALFLSNVHRSIWLRDAIDWPIASRMIAGALVGAILGGLLAGVVPPWLLKALLVVLAVLAIAKALGVGRGLAIPRRASVLVPIGFGIGAMTGTAGGAGILFAPVVLALGLGGRTFVATTSAIATATHIGRVAGYASLGLFDRHLLGPTVSVAAALFLGNTVGERLRPRLSEKVTTGLEYGALVVCVALSVAGLG